MKNEHCARDACASDAFVRLSVRGRVVRAAAWLCLTGISLAHAVAVAGTGLQVVGPIGAVTTLTVNAVPFTTDGASVIVNGQAATVSDLGVGMTATVDGAWQSGSAVPAASQVAARRVVRAPARYVGVGGTGWAGTSTTTLKVGVGGTGWSVAGLDLMLGAGVQWVGAASLADVIPGATLDVYGEPDFTRSIVVASRIEVSAGEAAGSVDVTGAVGPATSTGFELGTATIDTTGAAFEGLELPLAAGTLVHVFGTEDPDTPGVIHATLVTAVVAPMAADGTLVRIAGLVQDYLGPSQFTLEGHRVDASAAYVTGGRLADLREGLHIEIDGVVRNGIVMASLVEIVDDGTALPEAEVEGRITALYLPSALRIGSTVVNVDSTTRLYGATSVVALRVGWKAHAHGVRAGTVILAHELEIER
jgi:hypothetical protein